MPNYLKRNDNQMLYKRYIASEQAQKKSANTIKAYDKALRRFNAYLDENKIDEITPLAVTDFKAELNEQGMSTNTINDYLGTLWRYFHWLNRMRVIKKDAMPISEEDIPKREFKKQSIPTKEEILKLIYYQPKLWKTKQPIKNHAIVTLMCLTGLRSDELRSLTLADCNFDDRYILVRNGKGGKERTVPFPIKAKEAVTEYLNTGLRPSELSDDDYLFGTLVDNRWNKMDSSTLYRMIQRYARRVIGKEIHPHTLRHCSASLWDYADVPMRDVQKALGHASITTTERVYMHILDDHKSAMTINSALDNL